MSDLVDRLRSTRRWDINAISPVYADLACEAAAEVDRLRAECITESRVLEFLGWLSVELPELHDIDCTRLVDAWDKFHKECPVTKSGPAHD